MSLSAREKRQTRPTQRCAEAIKEKHASVVIPERTPVMMMMMMLRVMKETSAKKHPCGFYAITAKARELIEWFASQRFA